jgi:hypothetical protein
MTKPLTVVVVSDFEPTEQKNWHDELRMVEALARQDFDEAFDVIIVESERHRDQAPPAALWQAFPDLQVVYAPSEASAQLKDYRVRHTSTPWVAVFEADSTPEPGWLRIVYGEACARPEFSIFSGRTHYGTGSSWKRVLNLLDRSAQDLGESAETTRISNNNALYKTDVVKRFPYPEAITPFLSARLRNQKILGSGVRCFFERRALARHAVGGLRFVVDYRRNSAYSDAMMLKRRTWFALPILLWRRLRSSIRAAARLGTEYLRWYDWPLWLVMAVAVRVPETIGIAEAVRKAEVLRGSAYR